MSIALSANFANILRVNGTKFMYAQKIEHKR